MVIKIRIILLLTAVFLSCSTPYQPKGMLGGYSSIQLNDNSFNVSFYGNQHTTQEKVRTYLLYYCAELTLQNGFEYFYVTSDLSRYSDRIIREDIDVSSKGKTTQSMSGGINTRTVPSFNYASKTTVYVGEFLIQMFKQSVPEYKKYIIYAPDVIKDLGKNIK